MERERLFRRPVKQSSLLPTESVEEYERDRRTIEEAIKPRDAILRMYCDDLIYERLQTWRLQRWSTAILNAAFAQAVYAVCVVLTSLRT
jgi:hypothetical protein